MEGPDASGNEKCGEKRKDSKREGNGDQQRRRKKPWGPDGPPPSEWIEVPISTRLGLIKKANEGEEGSQNRYLVSLTKVDLKRRRRRDD